MMSQLGEKFSRVWRSAFFGTAALFVVIGHPSPGRSQQAASLNSAAAPAPKVPAVSPQQIMASIKSPIDITPVRDGIRDGILFHATAPLSEEALRQKDGTPAEASFTVPLTVDRVHNRLFVQALVNNKKIRLILDTGAPPAVSLNEATAHGIELADKVSIQTLGIQGYAPANLGIVNSLMIGNLTLQQIPTTVSRNNTFYDCTLGLSVFEHYRVTLDFAAKTMTLTRGGSLTPPPGGAFLSIPFDDYNGYIFIPVHVLDQAGWAMLDSGSDVTDVSFEAAKAAAARLSSSDTKTITTDQKIGIGDTARKIKVIGVRAPIPITMNTDPNAADFNTTSWIGTSDIDDLGLAVNAHLNARLGSPFLLQFQRVIIDYPSHTLILQYPARNTFIKAALSPTDHDKPWPGYKWQQVGYAWIEVPDGKSAPVPTIPTMSSSTENGTTTITRTTEAGTTISRIFGASHAAVAGHVAVSVSASSVDGNITVAINGVEMVYPPGSTITVEDDGSIHTLPPGGGPAK